jgi:hypothetical protein
MEKKNYGGKRKGAGRKKREKTKVMRIPESLVSEIENMLKAYKASITEKSNLDNV